MVEMLAASVFLQLIGLLYWVLAVVLLAVVIYKGKTRRFKIVGAAVVVAVFGWMPMKALIEKHKRDAFAEEAWAYFKKLCDEKSGHKIYKTFTGVKSVVVLKPLPPATEEDLYDQYWYGDPYTNATPWSERGETAALRLTGVVGFDGTVRGAPKGDQAGFHFVEYPQDNARTQYYSIRRTKEYPYKEMKLAERVTSRFGVSWEDISAPEDRKYWIAGSRLRVIDLTDQSVVAERIGYLIEPGFGSEGGTRRPWLAARGPRTTCPRLENGDYEDRWFVLKVLIPHEGSRDGQ